jgi:histidyl-tRNA synthetase
MGLIDKTEKVGRETVIESATRDFGKKTGELLSAFLSLDGVTDEARLLKVQELLKENETANEGIGNLTEVFGLLRSAGYDREKIVFDPTIARGLDYYTGIIYETTLKQLPNLGSVCSGGRFDNLVAALGGPDLPAVGTSVGVDRLLDGLDKLGKLEARKVETQVLVANLDEKGVREGFKLATQLRREGVPTDVYGEPKKLEKQLKYADKLGILLAAIIGEDEVKDGNVTVKDLRERSQVVIPLDDAVEKIKVMLQKPK